MVYSTKCCAIHQSKPLPMRGEVNRFVFRSGAAHRRIGTRRSSKTSLPRVSLQTFTAMRRGGDSVSFDGCRQPVGRCLCGYARRLHLSGEADQIRHAGCNPSSRRKPIASYTLGRTYISTSLGEEPFNFPTVIRVCMRALEKACNRQDFQKDSCNG